MKKNLSVLAIVLTVLTAVSCKSTGSTGGTSAGQKELTQAEVNSAFEKIYAEYRDDIILDGAKEYTVKSGDSLSRIARDAYGSVENAYYFPLIMLASRNAVADPELIEPGTKLTIPDLQKNLNNAAARGEIKKFLKDVAGVYDQKLRGGDTNKQKAYEDFRTRLTALSNSL
jgi:LysM repeat protein